MAESDQSAILSLSLSLSLVRNKVNLFMVEVTKEDSRMGRAKDCVNKKGWNLGRTEKKIGSCWLALSLTRSRAAGRDRSGSRCSTLRDESSYKNLDDDDEPLQSVISSSSPACARPARPSHLSINICDRKFPRATGDFPFINL